MKTYKRHIPIRINLLTWIILVITLSFSLPGRAQTGSRNTLLQMIDDDRTTIDAIAGYDQEIQRHILEVAKTPELLNKIEELQGRSQSQFRTIIADYDQETQSAFYDLARYPGLISDLVRNGRPNVSKVNRIILNYPDDIRETANKYGRRYFDVLLRIDRLNNEIDREFKYALEPYNSGTRESVNVLIGYPEIVSALVDDKPFTTLLGDVYYDDPNWVMARLNQISQQLAENNREDLEAYKNQIQNDPEAYNELLDASEKYARENNEIRYLNRSYNPIEVRVVNSYPYWFGYPYWYSDPYWRPRPFSYHTGFYRNNYGAVVFVGLPSFNFIHWQTQYHPTLFPHLSYNYYSYYENHYMNRYRDSHRPIPHYGFYRSIEANVINNPRVNNSRLEQIDHQRGKNIVRQPNTMEYGSTRRGSSGISRQTESSNSRQGVERSSSATRRGTEGINRSGMDQRNNENGQGTANRRSTDNNSSRSSEGITTNRRGQESNSVRSSESGSVNRREFNAVNPERSESATTRRSSESGSSTIRREPSRINTTPGETSEGRTGQRTSINNGNSGNPRTNEANYVRNRENTPAATARQRISTENSGSRPTEQQRSASPQQRRETVAPAEQSERAASPVRQASRIERVSAPPTSEVRSAPRTEQRQSRTEDAPSINRREAPRESKSTPTSVSPDNSNSERSNGRRQ